MATNKTSTRITAAVTAMIASSAMLGTIAVPEPAFAVQETKVYTWANGEQQPNIPQTITGENGQELQLVSTTTPTQADASQTVTQSFNQTVSSTCSEGDIPNLANIVPATYHIDSGGFVGDIPRTGIDYTPIYRNEDNVFETTDTIMTSSDDQGALPASVQTISYQGHTLALTNVEFTPVSYEAGTPVLFQATLHYSGTFPQQVLDHYAVTAHYAGNLTRVSNDGEWSISATYEGPNEEDDNPEAGVTATFNDNESGTFTSNPENEAQSGSTNQNQTGNGGTVNNSGDNGNENSQEAENGNSEGIPILPIAVGGGIVILAGAGIGIGVAASKRKKKQQAIQQQPMPIGYDENGNAIMPDGSVIAADGTILSPSNEQNAQQNNDIFIADDPEEPIECELIQVDGDGEDDQTPIAVLDVIPSIASTVPTIITLPEVNEGEEFYPVDGADYYIAIEDTSLLVSDKMIIVSSDGQLVYQGDLIDQMRLDTEDLVNALNRTVPEDKINNISDRIAGYKQEIEMLRSERDARKDANLADQMESFDGADYSSIDYDDNDYSAQNNGQMPQNPQGYPDDQPQDDYEAYSDQMDRINDMNQIYGGEEESAYGDIDMGDGIEDNIDYDPYIDASSNGMEDNGIPNDNIPFDEYDGDNSYNQDNNIPDDFDDDFEDLDWDDDKNENRK